MNDQGKLVESW